MNLIMSAIFYLMLRVSSVQMATHSSKIRWNLDEWCVGVSGGGGGGCGVGDVGG